MLNNAIVYLDNAIQVQYVNYADTCERLRQGNDYIPVINQRLISARDFVATQFTLIT